MGQKVHPIGIRLGIVKDWTSKWYADSKHFADNLNMDLKVRAYIRKALANASVSRVQIERPANNARITIHTARPGIVIGKKGEDVEKLRMAISKMMGVSVNINIEEIRKPELDAHLVAENIAQQLERRIMFRRVHLHTLRADIDYGVVEANTTYGVIGVKVWLFKGEVLEKGIIPETQTEKVATANVES
jgi:small subunit ribosomal protein S3